MPENMSFYKVSWLTKENQQGEVYCCDLLGALFLFFNIKKTEETTELTFYPTKNSKGIIVIGGTK